MTTDILLVICAILVVIGYNLIKQPIRWTSKRGNSHFEKTLGIISFFLAGLVLVLAITNISSSNTLPPADADDSATPEELLAARLKKTAKPNHAAQIPADQWELPVDTANPGHLGNGLSLDPAAQLKRNQELDTELGRLSARLKENPYDAITYAQRGSIYAEKKSWDQAESDFRTALIYNNTLAKAAFDLAEMEFQQKKYDSARPGFDALKQDPNLGDLATYKVFLCDMLGGHEGVADRELDAFNQGDEGASHYFANIAWFLYHNDQRQARSWLKGAYYIYPHYKVSLYSSTLADLGYLPIPPEP